MTKFCPKCGTILIKNPDRDEYYCQCGYSRPITDSTHHSEKVKEPLKAKRFDVVDEKHNSLAVYDHKCPKCGYGKAQMIERGIQYSDEDDMTFFKCGKCGHMDMVEAKIS